VDRCRFWEIIGVSRKRAKGRQDTQFDVLEEQLRALSTEEIASFDAHFRACMGHADCNEVYAAAALIDGFWVSDDAFAYFLEWLVAQGQAVFENAVQNPDSLADAVEKGVVCAFEGFGYIAARLWEEKTGLSPDKMPGHTATSAKAPEGPAWKDDEDLKQRFPRLWEKFLQQGE
jgi:Protein of unknown function (DUF4240)